ncbi:MAG: hypothetical protein K0Q77_85 [Anaerosporomusa subterranea]|nr:hypothetical protein [Anaerosporomusa subterranea]
MAKTKIEWADKTWNPITGCTKISPGCHNCYAERMAKRLQAMGQERYRNGFKPTCHMEVLEEPFRWQKPKRIFVCSMSDLFHEDVPFEFIAKVWEVFYECGPCKRTFNDHTFLVLTKRPERMLEFSIWYRKEKYMPINYSNVWLGVTAENQEQADIRIPILLQIPAEKRFVSVEPMLGSIVINQYLPHYPRLFSERNGFKNFLDWVICGGESGPGARPVHPAWVRGLRDQCQTTGVPFLFKQWGLWWPISQMPDNAEDLYYPGPEESPYTTRKCRYQNGALQLSGELLPTHKFGSWGHGAMQTFKVGKKKAGRLLDGHMWDQYPEAKNHVD